MVMEMQMNDGSWEASMAVRFPEALDDEIKKGHDKFYLYAQKLEPESRQATLQMSLPMTPSYEE
eukprot:10681695-Prorocentrum_lima.AAC.1